MVEHLEAQGEPGDCSYGSPLHPAIAAQKLRECGNWLAFHHYWTVGKVRLGRASFCKEHLLCPLCAIRRGSKALQAYAQRFRAIQAEDCSLEPYLVTLTVKNGPDLAERFEHLKASFQRLMKRRFEKRTWSVLKGVAGGVTSFEFTNKGNGWHPHTHSILLAPSPIEEENLAHEWYRITGDSYICDVRRFDPAQPVEHGFMEVFKYAVKFSELPLDLQWQAFRTLRGRRLLSSFGVFRSVEVPESMLDEPLEGPYVELMYRYFARRGFEYQYSRFKPGVTNESEDQSAACATESDGAGGLCAV